jgi:hypothetical protein
MASPDVAVYGSRYGGDVAYDPFALPTEEEQDMEEREVEEMRANGRRVGGTVVWVALLLAATVGTLTWDNSRSGLDAILEARQGSGFTILKGERAAKAHSWRSPPKNGMQSSLAMADVAEGKGGMDSVGGHYGESDLDGETKDKGGNAHVKDVAGGERGPETESSMAGGLEGGDEEDIAAKYRRVAEEHVPETKPATEAEAKPDERAAFRASRI